MLAIDTNVIVRYLVGDDPAQANKARALIDGNDVYVCTTVFLEAEWVLRGVYELEPETIADALGKFAGLPHVTIENSAVLTGALAWMKSGIDFADAMHLLQAERKCESFVTFDRQFAKVANRLGAIPVRIP